MLTKMAPLARVPPEVSPNAEGSKLQAIRRTSQIARRFPPRTAEIVYLLALSALIAILLARLVSQLQPPLPTVLRNPYERPLALLQAEGRDGSLRTTLAKLP